MKEMIYILLLIVTSSISASMMIVFGIMLLKKRNKYRFQTILGVLLVFISFLFLNNVVMLCFIDYENKEYVNILFLLLDYLCVSGFLMFLHEIINPNRLKLKHLLFYLYPFLVFTVFYAVSGNKLFYRLEQIFTILCCSFMYVKFKININRQMKRLKNNYSSIENMDIKWVAFILRILLVWIVIWIAESFSQTRNYSTYISSKGSLIASSLYNIAVLLLAYYLFTKTYRQEVAEVNEEGADEIFDEEDRTEIPDQDIDVIIREKGYYLNNNITLTALARELGMNRSYLSAYINKNHNSNFCNYINNMRLEKAEEILKTDNSNINLEDVAIRSGFNSYSTFRRAFVKKHDVSPSVFKKKLEKESNC